MTLLPKKTTKIQTRKRRKNFPSLEGRKIKFQNSISHPGGAKKIATKIIKKRVRCFAERIQVFFSKTNTKL